MPPSSHSLELSPPQQQVLDANARLKIVSACPGAGKTRLFVAALKHYRSQIKRNGCGVAALSFTNVAQGEIAERLGSWDPPHFVGTIDSFLLRFVLRPFGHLVGVRREGVRLIPASLYGHFSKSIRVGETDKIRANIHDVTFVGEASGKAILKARGTFKTELVHDDAHASVLKSKQWLWKSQGHVSHSDSHYLCDSILGGPAGLEIAKIITTRFPFILVDELQDTQYFLGQALMRLYESPLVAGIAVGDSDQAIYEFGGAHPLLFEALSAKTGAQKFALDISRRCSGAVCKSAIHLSCRGAEITEADDAKAGRCVLMVLPDDSQTVAQTLASNVSKFCETNESLVILTRKNDTLSLLKGRGEAVQFPGPSILAGHTHTAVLRLLRGDPGTARRMIESDLAEMIFEARSGVRELLEKKGIDKGIWAKAVCSILFEAAKEIAAETWEQWQTRLKVAFATSLKILGQDEIVNKLGQRLRTHADLKAPRVLMVTEDSPVEWPSETQFFNVHEMKGLEADVVCFYSPRGSKSGPTIADDWWIPDSEERKVAFVACTRAKRLMLLAVHKRTFDCLQKQRQEFVKTFEIVAV